MENNNEKPSEKVEAVVSAEPEQVKCWCQKLQKHPLKDIKQMLSEFDQYTAIITEPKKLEPEAPELKWHQKLKEKLDATWRYLLQTWLVAQLQAFWKRAQELVAWLRLKPHQKISDEELTKAIELAQKYIEMVTPKSKDIYPPYRSGDCLKTEFKGTFRRRGKRYSGGNGFVKPTDELGK